MENDEPAPRAEPWTVLSSRVTYQDRWLTLRSDRCRTPAGKILEAYHVIEFPNWVNLVVLTWDLRLLMVREYRHGRVAVVEGLVSGMVEDGEDASATARRTWVNP